MQYLRQIINDAIEDDLVEKYPFRKYQIKMVPTAHRNLAIEDVRKIRDAEFVKKHARKSIEQWKDETQFGKYINKGMHQIQEDLKINTINLTCYSARHSVASILRSTDVDVSVDDIALVLGHKRPSMKVTSIYTAEDFIRADNAMRKLLDALMKKPEEKKDAAGAAAPKNDK